MPDWVLRTVSENFAEHFVDDGANLGCIVNIEPWLAPKVPEEFVDEGHMDQAPCTPRVAVPVTPRTHPSPLHAMTAAFKDLERLESIESFADEYILPLVQSSAATPIPFHDWVPGEKDACPAASSAPMCKKAQVSKVSTIRPQFHDASALVRAAKFSEQPSHSTRSFRRYNKLPLPGRSLSMEAKAGGVPVSLHVYDVSHESIVQWLNSLLLPVNLGGVFHAGVEVGGLEWSFAYHPRQNQPGVQCGLPQCDVQHHFRETIALGCTTLSADDITATISDIIEDYPGTSYDLLHRNCCHFADDFCKRLGVGPIPEWVHRLARIGVHANGVVQAVFGSQACNDGEQHATSVPVPDGQKDPVAPHYHVDPQRLSAACNIAEGMLTAGQTREPQSGHFDRWNQILQTPRHELNIQNDLARLANNLDVAKEVKPSAARACEYFPISCQVPVATKISSSVDHGIATRSQPLVPQSIVLHQDIDATRLADVFGVAEGIVASGRSCELYPVSRALTMVPDAPGQSGHVAFKHHRQTQRLPHCRAMDSGSPIDAFAIGTTEDAVAGDRACELCPVSRAFSLALEAGLETSPALDPHQRLLAPSMSTKSSRLEQQSKDHRCHMNGVPLAAGGC
jgi:hypothetical protein